MEKTYMGIRTQKKCDVLVEDGIETYDLRPRYDLRRHSPCGFEWGYGGSGPAQLALALCCDVLRNDSLAQMIYQRFKFRVVGRMQHHGWVYTHAELIAIMEELVLKHRLEHGDERACTQ